MLWLYRWFIGYVRVFFYGGASEQIFSYTARERITFWNTSLTPKGIEGNVSVKDFLKLPYILKKSGIRLHIVQKMGFPFRLHKNRKRAGIALGLVLLVVFLKIMSGYIWIIEVEGNEKVKTYEIINACNEIGIRQGIRSERIVPKTDRQRLLLKLESIAWASLNVEGCKLTVNVSESKPEKEDNSCICNLKANADGIIKKIDVVSGNCVVKKGDTVKKGDVLVSGVLEKADKTEFLHSHGKIIATVKDIVIVEENYIINKIFETGETEKRKVLEVFGIKIPLYLGKVKGEYNGKVTVTDIKLFGQKLPLKIYTKEFKFIKNKKDRLSEEELKKRLHIMLESKLINKNYESYKIEKEDITYIKDGLRLTATVSAEKSIAYRDKLIVSEEKQSEDLS